MALRSRKTIEDTLRNSAERARRVREAAEKERVKRGTIDVDSDTRSDASIQTPASPFRQP